MRDQTPEGELGTRDPRAGDTRAAATKAAAPRSSGHQMQATRRSRSVHGNPESIVEQHGRYTPVHGNPERQELRSLGRAQQVYTRLRNDPITGAMASTGKPGADSVSTATAARRAAPGAGLGPRPAAKRGARVSAHTPNARRAHRSAVRARPWAQCTHTYCSQAGCIPERAHARCAVRTQGARRVRVQARCMHSYRCSACTSRCVRARRSVAHGSEAGCTQEHAYRGCAVSTWGVYVHGRSACTRTGAVHARAGVCVRAGAQRTRVCRGIHMLRVAVHVRGRVYAQRRRCAGSRVHAQGA